MPTLPDGDWPPSLGRQYTRLAMIEQKRELPGAELVATMERDYIHGDIDNIVKRKEAIQLPEIFLPTEDGGQQLKILMDGAPGVGKSTLSRKVCKDWASGELLQQYHLVILLPLRQARIREATCIEDVIFVDDLDLKHQVVQHIRRTSGEHVMLIVDGYDELSYKDRTQNSLFLDIVQENQFSKCSVLVTSRPYASDYLQQLQCVNRHVEVLGFTKEQIEHCILQNIPDTTKATELVEALKERQDIASLCYIPLNCAIVLYVYKVEQCTLPHTLTKLYWTFILNAMKRHASIAGSNPIIRRLYTLAVIPESFQKNLNAVSNLAYDGLVVDKMVFSIEDIKAAFPDCSDVDIDVSLLGLMTVFKGFTSTGEELSYQFLHLTIQEFLAARWAASQLSDGEQLKFFQDHLMEERYRMVLLFLAGISHLKFPSAEDCFREELYFKHPVSREYSDRRAVDYFLFLSHLIYESQNFSLFHNLASTVVRAELFAAWYHIAPFDCLVLAHFLTWCDHPLKSLDLSYCGLTNQSLEIMHRVNLEHHGTTQIEEVNLSHNNLTKLSLLPKLSMFEHTRTLIIHGLKYSEGVSPDDVELHCMRHLTNLKISVKKIPNSSKKYSLSLGKFVKTLNMTELQVLVLQNVSIDSQNTVNMFRSLEHNTSLEELDLSGNSQLAEGDSEAVGCAIEKMLKVNKTLKVLNLSRCTLTNEVVSNFANGLAQNNSVRKVLLHSNYIGSAGAVSIFRSLEQNTSLEKLGLSRNRQLAEDDSEAVGCATERMLNVNKTLKVLNLSHCNVTDPIVKHILTGLNKNTSLVTLNMSSPKLSGSCAVSLFQHMTTHPTLSTVGEVNVLGVGRVRMDRGTHWCDVSNLIPDNCVEFFRALNNSGLKVSNLDVQDLTDQTAEQFAVGLAAIHSVQVLKLNHSYLEKNNIGSAGAVSIFRSLEHNTSLKELDLSGNWKLAKGDSEAVGCAIERMLNVNTTLKVLKLHGSDITNEVAEYFSNGLAQNCSLQKVVLFSNQVSSTGAVSIFRSLEHNTSLEELDLSGNRKLAKGDSEAVGCAIERMLNVNTTLKVLNLGGCGITNEVAEYFSNGLVQNCSLQRVALFSNQVRSTGAVSIFRSLECNTSLEELDLLGNSQLAEGDSEAVGCAIERMLNVNRTLKVFNLDGCRLTTDVASHFANGLAQNHSLRKVILRLNNIGSAGAVSIFRLLEHNTSLEELDLSGNSQLAEGDSKAVGCAIEMMLNVNRTLKVLNLSSCRIDTTVIIHTTAGLAHNACLAELNIGAHILSRNNITSGCEHLFKTLCNNTSLKKLDISHNNLGVKESVALAKMLSCNKSLTELNLGGCDISEAGLREIARGLLKNTTLQTLTSEQKTFLEAEIERLKKSGNFTPQADLRLSFDGH